MQKKRPPIQIINQQKVIGTGTNAFAKHDFRGTTFDQIEGLAGMSKPNFLYYLKTIKDIYQAVLEQTLNKWLHFLQEWGGRGRLKKPLQITSRKNSNFPVIILQDHRFLPKNFVLKPY